MKNHIKVNLMYVKAHNLYCKYRTKTIRVKTKVTARNINLDIIIHVLYMFSIVSVVKDDLLQTSFKDGNLFLLIKRLTATFITTYIRK